MTVLTAGCSRMYRSASSGSVIPSGTSGLQPVDARERRARGSRGVKYMLRKSPSGQRRVGGQRAGQAALVERHARDDRDVRAPGSTGRARPRGLVEDVVDDLHGVDQAGVERPQHVGRLPAVDADAERADQLLVLQVVDRALPARRRPPTRRSRRGTAAGRCVETPRFSQALLGVLADVVGAERRRRARTAAAPATCGSSAGSWWRRRGACSDARFSVSPSSRSLWPSP